MGFGQESRGQLSGLMWSLQTFLNKDRVMQSIFRPSVGIPAEESLLASSQALTDYGSEGWGFESLRARHTNHHNLGVQGAGPENGVARRLQTRFQTCDPERGVEKAFY